MASPTFSPDVPAIPLGAEGSILTIVKGSPVFSVGSAGSNFIAKLTASIATASLTIANIPQNFTSLQIIAGGRVNVATNTDMLLQFNGDTGANYDSQNMQAVGATLSGTEHIGSTSLFIGSFASTNAPATRFGVANVIMPNYNSTTFDKTSMGNASISFAAGAGGNITQSWLGTWRIGVPAAITSILLQSANGNMLAGSFISVYGLL